MPSAFWSPCHARVHLAPASITPGIAVIVTSRGGAGWGNVRWAFACWTNTGLHDRVNRRRRRRFGDMMMLYRLDIAHWRGKGAEVGHRTDGAFRTGALAELLPMTLE